MLPLLDKVIVWDPGPLGNSNIWSYLINSEQYEASFSISHYSKKHPISEMMVLYYELCLALRKTCTMWCRSFFFPISISIFVTCTPNNKQLENEGISPLTTHSPKVRRNVTYDWIGVFELWHFQLSSCVRGNMLFNYKLTYNVSVFIWFCKLRRTKCCPNSWYKQHVEAT